MWNDLAAQVLGENMLNLMHPCERSRINDNAYLNSTVALLEQTTLCPSFMMLDLLAAV